MPMLPVSSKARLRVFVSIYLLDNQSYLGKYVPYPGNTSEPWCNTNQDFSVERRERSAANQNALNCRTHSQCQRFGEI